MAIHCFRSLLKFSSDPLNLIIHDDGTLTAEDSQRLQQELTHTQVIMQPEADDLIIPLLKNYPQTEQFRREVPHAVKLIDIPLLSQGDIAFCDSDILFFRPFQGLFQAPDAQTSALFMQDYVEAYSIFPWHLLTTPLRLPSKVNSGLIWMRQSAYDLAFVEWFLSQPAFRSKPLHKMEQTCWAALGHRAHCQLWNPSQIVLMRSHLPFTPEMVAGHFVKEVRPRLTQFLPQAEATPDPAALPVSITTLPAQDCDIWGLAQNHWQRQSNRVRSHQKKWSNLFRQRFLAH
ncbi:MAG: hypothetical protein MUF49_19485 [Oculatellaceae cyanobacterium Prado106]|jgi:hypothetical protein|nr:hypothetical protein [Oculatellaceae cyanobacterium Prado106]